MAITIGTPSGKKYTFPMKGLESVMKNLNAEIKKIKSTTQAGIITSAYKVLHDALKITPTKTGALRKSSYVTFPGAPRGEVSGLKAIIGDKEIWAAVGYSIYYALFVHEINKNYEVGGWKFLETALKQNKDKILEIIKKRAKIQ